MWLPIIAHFVNNGFAVIAMYLVDKNIVNPKVENIGSESGDFLAIGFSAVIVVLLMWLIKKENRGNGFSVRR